MKIIVASLLAIALVLNAFLAQPVQAGMPLKDAAITQMTDGVTATLENPRKRMCMRKLASKDNGGNAVPIPNCGSDFKLLRLGDAFDTAGPSAAAPDRKEPTGQSRYSGSVFRPPIA